MQHSRLFTKCNAEELKGSDSTATGRNLSFVLKSTQFVAFCLLPDQPSVYLSQPHRRSQKLELAGEPPPCARGSGEALQTPPVRSGTETRPQTQYFLDMKQR